MRFVKHLTDLNITTLDNFDLFEKNMDEDHQKYVICKQLFYKMFK